MKVLQVCSYYSSALYRLLFDSLRKLGVDSRIYYFAVKGTAYGDREKEVLYSECYHQFDRLFFKHREKKAIASLLREESLLDYNLSHAHSLFANGYASLSLKRRFGLPYIVAVRNSDVNDFFKVRPWLRRTGVRIMEEAEQVVFISPSYRDSVLEKYVPDEKRRSIAQKSCVLPNGINDLFLSNKPRSQRVNDGVIRVVQVGDINKNKNQLSVASACEDLLRSGQSVNCLIVGRTVDKRIAGELESYSCVTIRPPMKQRDLIEAYRSSDVFVMPSIHETFGLVYVEAMSQGLPVVYTRGQGFDGYFPEDTIGRSVDPLNKTEIKDAVLYLYKNRNEFFDSCIRASAQFNWQKISSEYLRLYKRIG